MKVIDNVGNCGLRERERDRESREYKANRELPAKLCCFSKHKFCCSDFPRPI